MTQSSPPDDLLALPDDTLRLVESRTAHLLRALEGLTEEQARGPSRLPGWTRGHTLTHIARNADALVNLLTWARTGEERPMYPSREARDAAIAEGAGRSPEELRADVAASHERFLAAAGELAADDWDREVVWGVAQKRVPARQVPFHRLTEVEVHHVDAGLGHEPADWPPPFVQPLLRVRAGELSERDDVAPFTLRASDLDATYPIRGADGRDDPTPVVSGPAAALLAWTIGRGSGDQLSIEPAGELPQLGAWR